MQMYPDHLPQLQELSKWIDNQRTSYQNGLHGKKNPLSDERIRLLVQADFDFGSKRVKSLHYKSWNEKLQELKEFKERYVQTVHELSPASWVPHLASFTSDMVTPE